MNAFKVLLSDLGSWRASLEGLEFSRLEVSSASKLEEPFTEAEIHAALLNLNGDKAPGPDGFTAAFWQLSWDQSFKRRKRKARRFCVCEARRKPRGVEA